MPDEIRDFLMSLEVTGTDEITLRCDRNALTVLYGAARLAGTGPSLQMASMMQDCLLFQLPKRGE